MHPTRAAGAGAAAAAAAAQGHLGLQPTAQARLLFWAGVAHASRGAFGQPVHFHVQIEAKRAPLEGAWKPRRVCGRASPPHCGVVSNALRALDVVGFEHAICLLSRSRLGLGRLLGSFSCCRRGRLGLGCRPRCGCLVGLLLKQLRCGGHLHSSCNLGFYRSERCRRSLRHHLLGFPLRCRIFGLGLQFAAKRLDLGSYSKLHKSSGRRFGNPRRFGHLRCLLSSRLGLSSPDERHRFYSLHGRRDLGLGRSERGCCDGSR